jgi:cytochrome c biogenesis protein CcmG/thiol:disulfide interchange protein DsbE
MKYFCLFLLFFSLSANAGDSKIYPLLRGKTLDGKNFDLKEKRGQVVLVNFWATWCIDCRKELPILDEIYKELQAQGLEIIGVSTDRKQDRAKVLEVVGDKKYLNLFASDLTKNDFPDVAFLPTSYVIDRDGKLIGEIIVDDRAITKKDFEEVLKPLLKK